MKTQVYPKGVPSFLPVHVHMYMKRTPAKNFDHNKGVNMYFLRKFEVGH